MSTLTIVLLVLGGLFLAGVGTCAAGAFWLKGKAESVIKELDDGGAGFVMISPPAVKAELAGAKKDYVGDWRAEGSTLSIDAEGNVKLDKHHGGTNQTFNAPIAAFAGNDMEIKVLIKMVLKVSRPPRKVGDASGGHWEMTVDGIPFERK